MTEISAYNICLWWNAVKLLPRKNGVKLPERNWKKRCSRFFLLFEKWNGRKDRLIAIIRFYFSIEFKCNMATRTSPNVSYTTLNMVIFSCASSGSLFPRQVGSLPSLIRDHCFGSLGRYVQRWNIWGGVIFFLKMLIRRISGSTRFDPRTDSSDCARPVDQGATWSHSQMPRCKKFGRLDKFHSKIWKDNEPIKLYKLMFILHWKKQCDLLPLIIFPMLVFFFFLSHITLQWIYNNKIHREGTWTNKKSLISFHIYICKYIFRMQCRSPAKPCVTSFRRLNSPTLTASSSAPSRCSTACNDSPMTRRIFTSMMIVENMLGNVIHPDWLADALAASGVTTEYKCTRLSQSCSTWSLSSSRRKGPSMMSSVSWHLLLTLKENRINPKKKKNKREEEFFCSEMFWKMVIMVIFEWFLSLCVCVCVLSLVFHFRLFYGSTLH